MNPRTYSSLPQLEPKRLLIKNIIVWDDHTYEQLNKMGLYKCKRKLYDKRANPVSLILATSSSDKGIEYRTPMYSWVTLEKYMDVVEFGIYVDFSYFCWLSNIGKCLEYYENMANNTQYEIQKKIVGIINSQLEQRHKISLRLGLWVVDEIDKEFSKTFNTQFYKSLGLKPTLKMEGNDIERISYVSALCNIYEFWYYQLESIIDKINKYVIPRSIKFKYSLCVYMLNELDKNAIDAKVNMMYHEICSLFTALDTTGGQAFIKWSEIMKQYGNDFYRTLLKCNDLYLYVKSCKLEHFMEYLYAIGPISYLSNLSTFTTAMKQRYIDSLLNSVENLDPKFKEYVIGMVESLPHDLAMIIKNELPCIYDKKRTYVKNT